MYVAVSDARPPATATAPGATDPGVMPGSTKSSDAALEGLPMPVRRQLGHPVLAMTLDLDENRRLGQENVRDVLANLASRGFHVQMPRDIEPIVEAVADAAISDAATRRATNRDGGVDD